MQIQSVLEFKRFKQSHLSAVNCKKSNEDEVSVREILEILECFTVI